MSSFSDGPERTYAISLESIVREPHHIEIIQNAVLRMHRITIDATELLALHITRLLENDDALPTVDASYIKMLMMEVTTGRGKRLRIDDKVEASRLEYMTALQPTDRKGLDQCLMLQSISLASSFATNLWFHFQRRMMRLVRCAMENGGLPQVQELESKQRSLEIMKIASDVCRLPCVKEPPRSKSENHDFVNEWRSRLSIDSMTGDKLKSAKHHSTLLKATYIISRYLESNSKRGCALTPVRTQFRPQFMTFDSRAIAAVLGVPLDAEDPHSTWNDIITLRKINPRKGFSFAGSLRTDGVSVRVLYSTYTGLRGKSHMKKARDTAREAKKANPTAPSGPIQTLRPNLYCIDEVKHLSREKMQIIGCDPGKAELLVCVDMKSEDKKKPSVRYTAKQRNSEMLVAYHAKLRQAELPQHLKATQEQMGEHSRHDTTTSGLHGYFQSRREHIESFLEHYSAIIYRKRHWYRFRKKQYSLDKFINRIKSLQRDKKVPLVLAYGSWGGIAGRPGSVANRGRAPCIGVGLRAKLSKHFAVVTTPEHNTSKTCSICEQTCGACAEVDAVHRAKKMQNATTDAERRAACRFSVRGIRRCCNASCGAFLNRDHNGATNIGRRAHLAIDGGDIEYSDDDKAFDVLEAELHLQ